MKTKNISCDEVIINLSAYHDNLLEPKKAHLISQHLESCPDCGKIEDNIFQIKSTLPELNEDVPFHLRNRLYLIGESSVKKPKYRYFTLMWIAATLGAMILFLNLFYFTNIYPSANRLLHRTVSKIENFVVEAQVFIEQISGSEIPAYLKSGKKLSDREKKREKRVNSLKIRAVKGVKYG